MLESSVFKPQYFIPCLSQEKAERGGERYKARETLLTKSFPRSNIPWSDENGHLIKQK